ncbi:MAG: hypothetical protein EBZ47_06320 [Chlamydiae bacterium]|nr:hypothetical protein [Chlamydiota bacterium]
MNISKFLKEMHVYTSLLNAVNATSYQLMDQQVRSVRDLTNDEVWWTRAQACLTGISSSLSGISSFAESATPDNADIFGMNKETIQMVLKTFAKGCKVVDDVGTSIARGESILVSSNKSLIERCYIAKIQQDQNTIGSSLTQAIQTAQTILNLKGKTHQ